MLGDVSRIKPIHPSGSLDLQLPLAFPGAFYWVVDESGLIATPDVEAVFEFNNVRKNPAINGYRPSHLVKPGYLTSGTHHYKEVESVAPNGTAIGTITFITPEAYPACLWVGKRIPIQEGERIVGYATITKILNPILAS